MDTDRAGVGAGGDGVLKLKTQSSKLKGRTKDQAPDGAWSLVLGNFL